MENKFRISFIVLLFGLLASSIVHAEGGGLSINYNKFNLYLEFNDNVPEEGDEVTGMGYIREPFGILYDLISLVQANREVISQSRQEVFISVGNLGGTLIIYENQAGAKTSNTVLKQKNLKHFDSEVLLNNTCKALKIKNCQPPETTYIYVSDIPLDSGGVDLVQFGCFPCNNELKYTLTDRFTATKPDVKKPKFKKVTITRKTINRYFKKLVW